jgi:hypothetical protein
MTGNSVRHASHQKTIHALTPMWADDDQVRIPTGGPSLLLRIDPRNASLASLTRISPS